MSRYVAWNDLLLAEFFSPAAAQEEVWLRTSRDELDSIGLHLGGAEGLVQAVSIGAPWLPGGLATSAEAARMLVSQRRNPLLAQEYLDPGHSSPTYAGARGPTYLPILAVWVLASSTGQQDGGFYAEVSRLLGRPFGGIKVTQDMMVAWEDLQGWSIRECAGRFGNFHIRVLGAHRFVGVPRSQCLINRHDERNLPRLFWEFGLRPAQRLTDDTLSAILQRGREANFLTSPLRTAMGAPEYAPPLGALLQRYLAAWDGSRPRAAPVEAARRHSVAEAGGERRTGLSLVLTPSDEVANGWELGWSYLAFVDQPSCFLEIAGERVAAVLHRAGACFITDTSEAARRVSAAALTASALGEVRVEIVVEGEGDAGAEDQRRSESIFRAPRRILAWSFTGPRRGEALIERDIPLYGGFYVLCSPPEKVGLESWLEGEQIKFEGFAPQGLPEGWWMASIGNAGLLSAEQRQHLSNSDDAPEIADAVIRFVGGCPLLRGGARLFAAYDLPIIEFEGPPGSMFRCDGLDLVEIPSGADSAQSGIKRFEIRGHESGRYAFDTKVVFGSDVLAERRFRIAPLDGEGLGEARDFSLSSLGTCRNDRSGLLGAFIGSPVGTSSANGGWSPSEKQEIGSPVRSGASLEESVSAKFLDTLASRGSMPYGEAKDMLIRLHCDANPISIIMDLRAAGHIEVQADRKGHLVRIHRVAPTLYALPATQEGFPLYGVGGSLRLSNWASLLANLEFLPSVEDRGRDYLSILRLAAMDEDAVRSACAELHFNYSPCPSVAIASWAASVSTARSAAEEGGLESVYADLGHLHRLMPDSAKFVPVINQQMVIDQRIGAQLFRFDDPQVPSLQLYMLGVLRPNGAPRYSHVQDSRWGVWISQLAFASMLRNHHSLRRTDAFPWPLPYDASCRELLIPARLRPPAVLERALALCAGSGPVVSALQNAGRIGERLMVADARSGDVLGSVSAVYEAFLPGYWLRYRWVPEDLATQVAALLDCKLESTMGHSGVVRLEPLVT